MKKYFLLAMIFITTLSVVGCSSTTSDNSKQGKEKVLRVGTEATFAPFEFMDEQNKEFLGFDMDLIRSIAKEMGYTVEVQNMGFDALIPALEAKNIDVIMASVTITEERSKKLLFSEPYYRSGLSIIVKADNNTINSFKDLQGQKVAVQIGTVGAIYASKIPGAVVREFNYSADSFLEIKSGGVIAAVNDLPVNQYYIKQLQTKDMKLVGDVAEVENLGIAVAKSNPALLDEINKALLKIKQNGEYDKIYQKWFASN